MIKTAAATAITLIALTGCAGTTTATPAVTTTVFAPAPTVPVFESTAPQSPDAVTKAARDVLDLGFPIKTPADIVARTKCTGYVPSSTFVPFATTYGTCTYKGSRLQIYTFGKRSDLDSWYETVRQYGIVQSQVAQAGLTVSATDNPALLEALRQDLSLT